MRKYYYLPCDWSKCYYCLEPATAEDHVLPLSYSKALPKYRFPPELCLLVPACTSCNNTASNKLFRTLEEKAHYIRVRRYKRALAAYDYELSSRLEMMLAE